ncbi:MAG: DnaJ family molecular chaperone [Pseudomonadota bacterium]
MSMWRTFGSVVGSLGLGASLKSLIRALGGEDQHTAGGSADEAGAEGAAGAADPNKAGAGERAADHGAKDQLTFTIAVIALGAKMAKADGVVTRDEVDAFKEVFIVPPGEEANVRRIFNLARQDVAGYREYATQIARLFGSNEDVLGDVMDGLFHIAKADNVIHPDEMAFLQDVGRIFGFDEEAFERIRCTHMMCSDTDPYRVLGVAPDIDDEGLKSAYRKLVRENHPDAMIARGVPAEFISMATEKLASINTAYEAVQKERGLS